MKKANETPETGEVANAATETVNAAPQLQSIEEKIQYFQRKQDQINRLRSLENTAENLQTHIDEVSKEAQEDIFLSENFLLSLSVKSGYRDYSDLLKFRNPVIIADLLVMLSEKVNAKIDSLKNEIAG